MSKRVWQNICQSVLKLCAVLFFSPVRFPYAEKRTVFEHRHVYSIWIGCYAMNLKWVAAPPKKEYFENITFHIFTLRKSSSAVGAFCVRLYNFNKSHWSFHWRHWSCVHAYKSFSLFKNAQRRKRRRNTECMRMGNSGISVFLLHLCMRCAAHCFWYGSIIWV